MYIAQLVEDIILLVFLFFLYFQLVITIHHLVPLLFMDYF